jgi:hypothetical protein
LENSSERRVAMKLNHKGLGRSVHLRVSIISMTLEILRQA